MSLFDTKNFNKFHPGLACDKNFKVLNVQSGNLEDAEWTGDTKYRHELLQQWLSTEESLDSINVYQLWDNDDGKFNTDVFLSTVAAHPYNVNRIIYYLARHLCVKGVSGFHPRRVMLTYEVMHTPDAKGSLTFEKYGIGRGTYVETRSALGIAFVGDDGLLLTPVLFQMVPYVYNRFNSEAERVKQFDGYDYPKFVSGCRPWMAANPYEYGKSYVLADSVFYALRTFEREFKAGRLCDEYGNVSGPNGLRCEDIVPEAKVAGDIVVPQSILGGLTPPEEGDFDVRIYAESYALTILAMCSDKPFTDIRADEDLTRAVAVLLAHDLAMPGKYCAENNGTDTWLNSLSHEHFVYFRNEREALSWAVRYVAAIIEPELFDALDGNDRDTFIFVAKFLYRCFGMHALRTACDFYAPTRCKLACTGKQPTEYDMKTLDAFDLSPTQAGDVKKMNLFE